MEAYVHYWLGCIVSSSVGSLAPRCSVVDQERRWMAWVSY